VIKSIGSEQTVLFSHSFLAFLRIRRRSYDVTAAFYRNLGDFASMDANARGEVNFVDVALVRNALEMSIVDDQRSRVSRNAVTRLEIGRANNVREEHAGETGLQIGGGHYVVRALPNLISQATR